MLRTWSASEALTSDEPSLHSSHPWLSNWWEINWSSPTRLVSDFSLSDLPQLLTSMHPDFFTIAKLSNALLGSVIVSIVGLAAAVVAFCLVEKKSVGRWALVFWGVVGITISMRKSAPLPTMMPIYLTSDHSWHRYRG